MTGWQEASQTIDRMVNLKLPFTERSSQIKILYIGCCDKSWCSPGEGEGWPLVSLQSPPPPLARGQFIQRGQCGGWQGFWVMAWIAAANILPIYATHVHSSTSTVKHAENILEFLETILEYDYIHSYSYFAIFIHVLIFNQKWQKFTLFKLKWWL